MNIKTQHKQLWDAAKAVLKENFIAINILKMFLINDSNFHLMKLEKEEHLKFRVRLIKLKVKINEIEKRKK